MDTIHYYNKHIDPSAVDFRIEYFWLTLKNHFKNFYIKHPPQKCSMYSYLRNIDDLSDTLNHLQTNKEYNKICTHIERYLSYIMIDMIKVNDKYMINLLHTNFKRWNKIITNEHFNYIRNKEVEFIFVLFEIFYQRPKCKLFNSIDKLIIFFRVCKDDALKLVLYYIIKEKSISSLNSYRRVYPLHDTNTSSHKLIHKIDNDFKDYIPFL